MNDYSKTDLEEALRAIYSTISKCEKAQIKLREGMPQYTLTERRVKALRIAVELIERELGASEQYTYAIEPISEETRALATAYIIKEWQTARIMIRGEFIDCSAIDGFIVLDESRENVVGLVTYVFRDNACEIITLNSERPNTGLGTDLVQKVKKVAIAHGCKYLRLLTSNDNLNAIGFYQKRGFELVGVNLGAIDRERSTNKPEIPIIGQNAIPIHHEFDFSMSLDMGKRGDNR